MASTCSTALASRNEGGAEKVPRNDRGPGLVSGGMSQNWDRRDFLSLMGIGGLVFASGLPGCGASATAGPAHAGPAVGRQEDFFFLQLSDTHWGYQGPANPAADVTLERAVATINAVDVRPDFIVFTGDLTHTTDD